MAVVQEIDALKAAVNFVDAVQPELDDPQEVARARSLVKAAIGACLDNSPEEPCWASLLADTPHLVESCGLDQARTCLAILQNSLEGWIRQGKEPQPELTAAVLRAASIVKDLEASEASKEDEPAPGRRW